MSKRLVLLALVAGCATPTAPATEITQGEGVTSVAGTVSAPSPVKTSRAPRTVPKASRTRYATPVGSGTQLNSTAYCETGLMANGQHTYQGAVAGNRWKLGTVLHVSDSPYGPGDFTVLDHIGHGSDLDFAMPGDCAGARQWGRRTIRAQVVR